MGAGISRIVRFGMTLAAVTLLVLVASGCGSARSSSAPLGSRCCCTCRMVGYGIEPRIHNGPALAGYGAEAVRDAIAATITTLPD
jgi:hypothetical protein